MFTFLPSSQLDRVQTLKHFSKFDAMIETDPVTAQYYRRFDDDMPQYYRHGDHNVLRYSSVSTDGNDGIQHCYQNTTLSNEVPKLFMDTFVRNVYYFGEIL